MNEIAQNSEYVGNVDHQACQSTALHTLIFSTLCLKKCTNFETVLLRVLEIDFDEFGQKYSKVSRIEFACLSFHVGLLFYQLFVFQTGHRKITPILTL